MNTTAGGGRARKAALVDPELMSPEYQSKTDNASSAKRYIDGILAGDRAVLAKAITLVESSRANDRDLAEEVAEGCLQPCSNSVRVGITGVPGVGKSTMIEALGRHVVTECGEKVAVLAVDPTSPSSGGSILGDKTRMNFLASCDMAFIRPTPTRGTLGGVAQHTREAIALCEAAGYRIVFVETVGVGQSETAVREMVDFFLLVTMPGAGDELQGIKRGIMEMTDAVVVNKADGENIRAAQLAQTDINSAMQFVPAYAYDWKPPVLSCSARTRNGISEIWSCINDHQIKAAATGWRDRLRREQRLRWFEENVREGLIHLFLSDPLVTQRMPELKQEIAAGRLSALCGARRVLNLHRSSDKAR